MKQIDKGKIYVVATPIGNLEDITFRAINTLKNVDLIACEGVLHSEKLFNKYDINTKRTRLTEDDGCSSKLIALLISGSNIAIVSDAGTPGISDPGSALIRHALRCEITVVPIPGPSSAIAAASVSGLDLGFVFCKFLPTRTNKERLDFFSKWKDRELPLLFFESPKRIMKTLEVICDVYGENHSIMICREMTKKYESIHFKLAKEWLIAFGAKECIGEIVVVVPAIKNLSEQNLDFEEFCEIVFEEKITTSSKKLHQILGGKMKRKDCYDFIMKARKSFS